MSLLIASLCNRLNISGSNAVVILQSVSTVTDLLMTSCSTSSLTLITSCSCMLFASLAISAVVASVRNFTSCILYFFKLLKVSDQHVALWRFHVLGHTIHFILILFTDHDIIEHFMWTTNNTSSVICILEPRSVYCESRW